MVTGRQCGQCWISSVLNLRHGPLPAVEVAKARSVSSADDLVAIAFQSEQEDGFADTASPPRERHEISIPADTAVGVC